MGFLFPATRLAVRGLDLIDVSTAQLQRSKSAIRLGRVCPIQRSALVLICLIRNIVGVPCVNDAETGRMTAAGQGMWYCVRSRHHSGAREAHSSGDTITGSPVGTSLLCARFTAPCPSALATPRSGQLNSPPLSHRPSR